jgi:hypothetical protein
MGHPARVVMQRYPQFGSPNQWHRPFGGGAYAKTAAAKSTSGDERSRPEASPGIDGCPAGRDQARGIAGVQVQGQAEQPRVLLVSAPYALKAGDAGTIGGLPPSAFVLAMPVRRLLRQPPRRQRTRHGPTVLSRT